MRSFIVNEIVICVGPPRAGKTDYAYSLVRKKTHFFIPIDGVYDYIEENYTNFLDIVVNQLNNSLNCNFVLGGYCPHLDLNFNYLRGKIKHKIVPVILFAPIHILKERVEITYPDSMKEGKEKILANYLKYFLLIYKNILSSINISECQFVDSSNYEYRRLKSFDEGMEIVLKDEVASFLQNIPNQQYDKFYQTITLPCGLKIEGYAGSEKTWEKIKDLVDFKDKSVLEIGCFHGYFLHQIADLSPKRITGYESHPLVFDNAKKIATFKGLFDIEFELFDADKDVIKEKFDIILLLNILHHLKNPDFILDQVFINANTNVILEMNFDNISKKRVLEIAELYSFKVSKEIVSHRPNRLILIFKKEKGE